jgi:hypothetical protein
VWSGVYGSVGRILRSRGRNHCDCRNIVYVYRIMRLSGSGPNVANVHLGIGGEGFTW